MRKILPFLFIVFLLVSCSTSKTEAVHYSIYVPDLEIGSGANKHGNIRTTTDADTFLQESGFAYGDIVKISFLGRSLEMPIVPIFSSVKRGEPGLALRKTDISDEFDMRATLFINYGDFLTTYGIAKLEKHEDGSMKWIPAEDVIFPLTFEITLVQKAGYLKEVELSMLARTNNREDYPHLTDWQYANFRQVKTTGMGNCLYRSSTPLVTDLGRDTFAMKALEEAGVNVIINVDDNSPNHKPDSYYTKQNVFFEPMSIDITSDSSIELLARILRFMADNPGVYCVHCKEGKDRTGFIIAVLELFMGASVDEVIEDYMVSYENFYGVEKGTQKYTYISMALLDQLDVFNLRTDVNAFLKKIGLTDDELARLRRNLSVI
jgi:hypothetical protein